MTVWTVVGLFDKMTKLSARKIASSISDVTKMFVFLFSSKSSRKNSCMRLRDIASRPLKVLDFLLIMTSKKIVVSLAIMGAVLTTFARALSSFVVSMIGDRLFESRDLVVNRIAKGFSTSGYAAMSVSIFLFIVSGFIIDLS